MTWSCSTRMSKPIRRWCTRRSWRWPEKVRRSGTTCLSRSPKVSRAAIRGLDGRWPCGWPGLRTSIRRMDARADAPRGVCSKCHGRPRENQVTAACRACYGGVGIGFGRDRYRKQFQERIAALTLQIAEPSDKTGEGEDEPNPDRRAGIERQISDLKIARLALCEKLLACSFAACLEAG